MRVHVENLDCDDVKLTSQNPGQQVTTIIMKAGHLKAIPEKIDSLSSDSTVDRKCYYIYPRVYLSLLTLIQTLNIINTWKITRFSSLVVNTEYKHVFVLVDFQGNYIDSDMIVVKPYYNQI